jgi:hypothetical protein
MWIFEPTARLKDFESVPQLKEDWSDFINQYYETNLIGKPNDKRTSAVEELQRWGGSGKDLRVFNPASTEIPASAKPKNVFWSALPTSFDEDFDSNAEKFAYLDNQQEDKLYKVTTRMQDEYCEWVVKRNDKNQITEVIFTSEPPEYYDFMFNHSEAGRKLLVDVYRKVTGVGTITIDELKDENGEYNWWNQYNNDYAVHMQQPNNTLGAQVNIVSRACILRFDDKGKPYTDALGLIKCARYGKETRQSDPRIGNAVNAFARENRFITIENPVGLYMSGVDWKGWKTPDGTDAKEFWTVERGTEDEANRENSYIVRAKFAVPAAKGYTVSDVKIGGKEIEFGAEIAARIDVRVAVLVGDAADIPKPRAIGCVGVKPPHSPGFAPAADESAFTEKIIEKSLYSRYRGEEE